MIKKNENAGERPRIKPPELRPRPAPGTPMAGSPPGGGPRRPRRNDRMRRMPMSHVAGPSTRRPKFNDSQPATAERDAEASALGADAVRFVPLDDNEEVGRNCMFLEYKNEIVVIDVGLQFPEEETQGIDYIIPNTEYLEKKKGNIQA